MVEARKFFDRMIFINSLRILYMHKYVLIVSPHSPPPQLLPGPHLSLPPNFMFFCVCVLSNPVCAAHMLMGEGPFAGAGPSTRDHAPQENWHLATQKPPTVSSSSARLGACETLPTARWGADWFALVEVALAAVSERILSYPEDVS